MDHQESCSPAVVICGSFHKHLWGIQETIRAFANLGVRVLSPKLGTPIDPTSDFVVFDTDTSRDPWTLEQRHLEHIAAADAVYIYNQDSYMGPSTTMELGYAVALEKQVYTKEKVLDWRLGLHCQTATPEQVKGLMGNHRACVANHLHHLDLSGWILRLP